MENIIVVGDPELNDTFVRLRKLLKKNDKHYGNVDFIDTFEAFEKRLANTQPALFILCGVPVTRSDKTYSIGDIAARIKAGNTNHGIVEFGFMSSSSKHVDRFVPHTALGECYEDCEEELRQRFPGMCVSDLGAASIINSFGRAKETSPLAFIAAMQCECQAA